MRNRDTIEAAFAATAASASTPADIAAALAGLESGEAEQIRPDFLAAFCRAKDIDPEAPDIIDYTRRSREYKERQQREAADEKAKSAAQALAADAQSLADNLGRGVSATAAEGKSREEIGAAIDRIAHNAAALQNTDAEPDRVGTWADFQADCITYDPDADFRPAILAGLSFPDGTLSYIGARTGRGKTTIMLNIAREALAPDTPPRKVVFVTLEESRKQLLRKLILSTAYGNANAAEREALDKRAAPDRADGRTVKHDFYTVMRGDNERSRGLSGEGAAEFYRLVSAAKERMAALYGRALIIYEAQGLQSLERVEAAITEYANAGDIVLVDYVQRLPAPQGFTATDYMLGKAQSNGLFTTAKRTGAVIISGAQFKRPPPGQSSASAPEAPAGFEGFDETAFRESGDIEQDAHNALGIGKGKDADMAKERYIKVMKTREDATGGNCYALDFKGAYAFMDIGDRLAIGKAKKDTPATTTKKAEPTQEEKEAAARKFLGLN
jgi:hypothetical protein